MRKSTDRSCDRSFRYVKSYRRSIDEDSETSFVKTNCPLTFQTEPSPALRRFVLKLVVSSVSTVQPSRLFFEYSEETEVVMNASFFSPSE